MKKYFQLYEKLSSGYSINKIGHSSMSSSIQRSKTTAEKRCLVIPMVGNGQKTNRQTKRKIQKEKKKKENKTKDKRKMTKEKKTKDKRKKKKRQKGKKTKGKKR